MARTHAHHPGSVARCASGGDVASVGPKTGRLTTRQQVPWIGRDPDLWDTIKAITGLNPGRLGQHLGHALPDKNRAKYGLLALLPSQALSCSKKALACICVLANVRSGAQICSTVAPSAKP